MSLLRRVGPVPALFLGFWLLLMIAGREKLLRDPGTFWHTRVGEKILRDGFFSQDPFSFTFPDGRWVPHQWLGELVMALAHRFAGFDTLLLLASSVLAALITILSLRLLRTGLHPIVALLFVFVAFAAGAMQFHVRPLLVTMVLMTFVSIKLTDFETGQVPLRKLFWLVPTFVMWTNAHGGMIGGLSTVIAAGVGWSSVRALGWSSPLQTRRDLATFGLLVILCGMTAFVNPYGWEIPRAWLHIMRGPKLTHLIDEHKRLDPADPIAWPVFACAALYLFVLGGLRERPKIVWLLPILWLVQSFLRVRHAPLFALLSLVAITDCWPHTRWAAWLASRRPDLYSPGHGPAHSPRWVWLLPSALVLVVVGLQAGGVRVPVFGAGWSRLEQKRWPVELVPLLKLHEPKPGEPNRLFNSCNFGGFAIYYVPGFKVFLDDRVELYGEDFYEDQILSDTPETASDALDRWQRQYGRFDFALVEVHSAFAAEFRKRSEEWELLGSDPAGVFFRRRN